MPKISELTEKLTPLDPNDLLVIATDGVTKSIKASTASVQGATGIQGATGVAGVAGATGVQGVQGTQGVTGAFVPSPAVSVPALDIDWAAGAVYHKSISANSTFTFSNVSDGKIVSAIITNTSGSPVTLTLPTIIKNAGFVYTVAANSTNVYTFVRANSNTYASFIDTMV